ncbi:Uromodulinlike (Silurana), partial [Caligus rogercresseyi]
PQIRMGHLFLLYTLLSLFASCGKSQDYERLDLDFTGGRVDPNTGDLCVIREVCIPASSLPECESERAPGCDCNSDSECAGGGSSARCVACVCKDCPESANVRAILNPPLTFLVDTTRSVKPDKYSIFNLTKKVVERIQETETNIPLYSLLTFNDFGPDYERNSEVRLQTEDVVLFKQAIIGLSFESYDGGRDSKERLLQGLLRSVRTVPSKSLIVVFTDNGSKDLKLKDEINRIKSEREIEVYIVLTPIYEEGRGIR